MVTKPLSDTERRDWVRLIRSQYVGPATFQSLMNHAGTIEAAIEIAPELARRGGRKRSITVISEAEAEDEIAAAAKIGARLIALCEPDYPDLLAAISDPPPVITVLGRTELFARKTIGMVGARNASAAGRRFTREVAAALGEAGLAIASGLARGIDTAAHEGSIDSGTIAVIAGGIDVVYPEENRSLYEGIAERGLIVAEQRFRTRPTARHFPPRNRLISGLSLGVVIVEAALRSGSLITARMALEQDREVFAVPGSPGDPRHRGTNRLLREGAILTEEAADILDVLQGLHAAAPKSRQAPEIAVSEGLADTVEGDDQARERLLESLSHEPMSVDELLRECQLSPAVALALLLELELAGQVERHPGNQVSLA